MYVLYKDGTVINAVHNFLNVVFKHQMFLVFVHFIFLKNVFLFFLEAVTAYLP